MALGGVVTRTTRLTPSTIALLLGVVASSIFVVLEDLGKAPGLDSGSYLMTRNWVLGQDYSGLMPWHYRPPLVGVLLLPFTWIAGDVEGSHTLTILAVFALPPAAYYLARAWLAPSRALWAAFVGVFVTPYALLLAGVAYLLVLALALSLVIIREVATPSKRSAWLVPALAFLLAGLNQTAPIIMAVAIIVTPVIWFEPRRVRVLALGALATAPWWPFVMLNTGNAMYFSDGLTVQLGVHSVIVNPVRAFLVFNSILALHRPSPFTPGILLGAIAPFLLFSYHPINNVLFRWFEHFHGFWLGIHVALQYGDDIASLWSRARGRFRLAAPIAVAACTFVVVTISSLWPLYQLNNTSPLSHDQGEALAYVKSAANPADAVAVLPGRWGEWAGGLTGLYFVQKWHVSPLGMASEEEDLLCAIGMADCPPSQASRIRWLLVDESPLDGKPIDAVLARFMAAPLYQGDVADLPVVLRHQEGNVKVYENLRPLIERESVTGRTWPPFYSFLEGDPHAD